MLYTIQNRMRTEKSNSQFLNLKFEPENKIKIVNINEYMCLVLYTGGVAINAPPLESKFQGCQLWSLDLKLCQNVPRAWLTISTNFQPYRWNFWCWGWLSFKMKPDENFIYFHENQVFFGYFPRWTFKISVILHQISVFKPEFHWNMH